MTASHLEGVALYAYGHSMLAGQLPGLTFSQRYTARVARRLGMELTTRAVSGYRMQDTALDALNTTPRTWTVGAPGVVLLHSLENDVVFHGANPTALLGAEHSLRAFLQHVSLGARWDGALAQQTGGRQLSAPAYVGGATWMLYAGETGQASFPWNLPGPLVIGTAALDSAAGGQFEVLADGAVAATVNTGLQCIPSALTGRGVITRTVALEGMGPGAHTVTLRPAGGGPANGQGPFLDWWGAPAENPPLVVVVPPLRSLPSGYALGAAASTPTTTDLYADLARRVALELPNVRLLDTDGWDPATMTGDGLHPDGRGQGFLADRLEAQLQRWVPGWLAGVTHPA